jgi:hypothetical protein
MIDFPIGELMDEMASLQWLERHLYPARLCCPAAGVGTSAAFAPSKRFLGTAAALVTVRSPS